MFTLFPHITVVLLVSRRVLDNSLVVLQDGGERVSRAGKQQEEQQHSDGAQASAGAMQPASSTAELDEGLQVMPC
jgi:hypothetical protein